MICPRARSRLTLLLSIYVLINNVLYCIIICFFLRYSQNLVSPFKFFYSFSIWIYSSSLNIPSTSLHNHLNSLTATLNLRGVSVSSTISNILFTYFGYKRFFYLDFPSSSCQHFSERDQLTVFAFPSSCSAHAQKSSHEWTQNELKLYIAAPQIIH